jgi:hypothetical protein
MIHGHAMTLDGFAYMLRTHGFLADLNGCQNPIVDVTCRDEDIPLRAAQVEAWLCSRDPDIESYVVIDDIDLGFTDMRLQFVKTDGKKGLTDQDADRVIELLREHQ